MDSYRLYPHITHNLSYLWTVLDLFWTSFVGYPYSARGLMSHLL